MKYIEIFTQSLALYFFELLVGLCILGILLGFAIGRRWFSTQRIKNRRRIKKVSSRVKRGGLVNEQDLYRTVTPFEFEELVYDALLKGGCKKVERPRYYRDNGLDGIVRYKGRYFYIQAKRYKGHIRKKDMVEFCKKVSRDGVNGLFVYLGKASKACEKVAENSNVMLIDSHKLMALFRGDSIRLMK